MSLKIKSVPQLIDLVRNEPVNFKKTPQINGADIGTGQFLVARRGELDTTHSPVALYNYNGNLNDSSATGVNLSVNTGTELYYPNLLFSGSQSFYANLSTELTTVHNSNHQITGDVTAISVVNLIQSNTLGYVVIYTADGESSATNALYSLGISSGVPYFWAEHGAGGTDVAYTLTNYDFPYNQWVFFAATRTSNVVQFYLNGAKWGPASSTLTAPDGGGSGHLWIGGWSPGANTFRVKGQIKTVKIIGSALTEAQMMTEYERVTGEFKFL